MKQVSGIELIFSNEKENKQNIFLYLEKDCWCAYERSAYYLAIMGFPVTLEREVICDGSIVLMKASFGVGEMRLPLFRSAVLRSVADDWLLFQLDKTIEGFAEWKDGQLSSLPA